MTVKVCKPKNFTCVITVFQKHSVVSKQTSAAVTGHVTNSVKARLRQCHTSGDPCNAYLIDRLQSIFHAAARLVNGSRKYDHVS